MPSMHEAVAELEAEQRDLEAVLRALTPRQWLAPTPAEGWDVRDQVAHLADTNEIAYDTASGGPRQLNEEALTFSSPEEFTQSGVLKGRAMEPEQVLEWWTSTAARVNDLLRQKDPKERVPWGLGMAARTLATARLMEHWAHALDIRAATGHGPNATPRLRSVVWLITNALPYAFSVANVRPPEGHTLRVEVDFDGERWSVGPADATDLISGDALEFCRLGVQRARRDETSLKADGPLADLALDNARAFL